jgi:hypothetical protein
MVIHRTEPGHTHFINVDLDVFSRSDLTPVVDSLGKNVCVLFLGKTRRTHHTHLEVTSHAKSADATIRRFCKLIEALPKSKRLLWDRATRRDFNIGIQAGTARESFELPVEAGTVAWAARLKARIVFTVYPPFTADEELRAREDAGRKVAEMDAEDERKMAERSRP